MQVFSVLGSVLTVVSFVLFAGIVVWAYGRGRKGAFERAALAPFALPDETTLTPAPLPEGEGGFVSRSATLRGSR